MCQCQHMHCEKWPTKIICSTIFFKKIQYLVDNNKALVVQSLCSARLVGGVNLHGVRSGRHCLFFPCVGSKLKIRTDPGAALASCANKNGESQQQSHSSYRKSVKNAFLVLLLCLSLRTQFVRQQWGGKCGKDTGPISREDCCFRKV